MIVTEKIDALRLHVRELRRQERRIGCVPTMGALHAGHISLVEECRKHVDDVIVTIFVNPTQFGEGEDFEQYPRPFEDDRTACEQAGVEAIFMPEIPSLYPDGYDTWVEVGAMSTILEGACRPGHFKGVTTIVAKLFNLVQPDVACFGAKDYQQQTIIRKMVTDLDMPIEIVICPTKREADGLAMSSRNRYLSPGERQSALSLSQALQIAQDEVQYGNKDYQDIEQQMLDHLNSFDDVQPEYAVIRDPDALQELSQPQSNVVALIAAYVGKTRLIDNRMISHPTE